MAMEEATQADVLGRRQSTIHYLKYTHIRVHTDIRAHTWSLAWASAMYTTTTWIRPQ
jgi:hypothetical protein